MEQEKVLFSGFIIFRCQGQTVSLRMDARMYQAGQSETINTL